MKAILVFALCILAVAAKKEYHVFTDGLNWYGAYRDCMNRGMQLATINSQCDEDMLEEAMKTAGAKTLWTSLSDRSETNKYVWMSTGKPVSYTNWNAGQPSHSQRDENCMWLQTFPKGAKWINAVCVFKASYACETKPCCSASLAT